MTTCTTGTTRGRTTARRLFASILASEFAILPEWMRQFASLAERLEADGSGTLTAEEIRSEIRRALVQLNEGREGRPAALAYSYGTVIAEDSRATLRDGVAIIPVIGPLFHYADEMHDVCGCSSYAQIARDIGAVRAARAANPELIKAALFEVDSPGGEVGGITEASAMMAELAAEIPTATFVPDLGASAAYWLGSSAAEVVVAPIARIGSIGVVAAYRPKGAGGGVVEIVSSQSPKKRPDVATPEGRAQVQATVDALAEVFVEAVAKNRGVSPDTVLSDFGQGDVLVGARAVEAGLADRIGTFESVLADLAAGDSQAGRMRPAADAGTSRPDQEGDMPGTNTPAAGDQPVITRAYLDQNHADLVATIRAEGEQAARTAAETSAQERYAAGRADAVAILALPAQGAEQLRGELAADATVTRGEAALRILGAMGERQQRQAQAHLDALAGDERNLPKPATTSTGDGEPSADQKGAGEILGTMALLGRTKKPAAK